MHESTPTAAGELLTDASTVSLKLDSNPETLTLVRGMLGGVGELLALDPELLDDLKTAISEACNNVVMHAYDGDSGPLWVCLFIAPDRIEVTVRDQGRGIPMLTPSDDRLQGVGIPIMRALAQQTAFRPVDDEGTEVWMQFSGLRDGNALYRAPSAPAPDDRWADRLGSDAIVSLSPVSFVSGVLGRLARAMAARARFSLDRFSDVYLVTDALAAHVMASASSGRIGFGISTDTRRLELTIGPFRKGASAGLSSTEQGEVGSALRLLSDQLEVLSENETEALRVVMLDAQPQAAQT